MGKQLVLYRCGHGGVEEVKGSRDAQLREVERRRAQLCRECGREERLREAADDAERRGLPDLEGTHDQVAWALCIRARRLAEMAQLASESYMAAARESLGHEPDAAEREQIAQLAHAATDHMVLTMAQPLVGHKAAAWWIERRGVPLGALLETPAVTGQYG